GTRIDIWASGIIVENRGWLVVSGTGNPAPPYGTNGGVVNFYIYGEDRSQGSNPAVKPGPGAHCKSIITSTTGPCGIPLASLWNDNGQTFKCIYNPDLDMTNPDKAKTCTGVRDYFYQYAPVYGDEMCPHPSTLDEKGRPKPTVKWTAAAGCPNTNTGHKTYPGYFGYKVLAVSYGGNLLLNGYKGTATGGS